MDEQPTTSGAPLGFRAGSIFGNYRLKRLLGKGGFGHVWQADDTVMDRVVALKLLRSEYSENESFRQRLFREARAAGRLHEPHVVPIHQCGEIDGQIYIDMRFVDGSDLEAVLSQHGPLAPERAVAVVRQIAAALDAAHSAGLVHRDVKPGNILLTADDFACLVDFGLANAASDAKLTTTGITIGTFAYMAPERLSADAEIDHRADVYALACVLYECLTGSRPYSGDMPALISAHLSAPIPQPSHQRPDIPTAFDDVIACGMAKAAADRYASAGDLARAAQHALTATEQVQADTIAASTQAPTVFAADVVPTVQATVPPAGNAHDRQSATVPVRRRSGRSVAIVCAAVVLVAAIGLTILAVANHRTIETRTGQAPSSPPSQFKSPPSPTPGEILPTADQLSSLCTQATDPGVPYTAKTNLVENGISSDEGRGIDHNLRLAYRNGDFPEYFNATNIQPAGPNAVTADVAISGPKFDPPVTQQLMILNQSGNWVLQHDSALALLRAATATG